MHRFNMVMSATLIALFVFSVSLCQAQGLLTVPGKTLSAVNELQGALSNLNDAENAATEILAGRKPKKISDDKWASLAQKYRMAADHMRNAPLVTEFDKSKYTVSFDQVSNCDTHDAAIAKLQGYLMELQQALQRGKDEQKRLAQALVFANESDATVRKLMDVSAKLQVLPDIGSTFAFQWADLELVVQPAIRDYRSALQAQIRRLDAEVAKVTIYESNLRSNLPAWEKLCPKSPLMGSYRGSGQAGVTFGGGQYWTYHTDFNMSMTVSINRQGAITFAEVSGRAVESVVRGGRGGIPANQHTYRSSSGQINGNRVQIQFSRVSGTPTCAAVFNGTIANGSISGTLTIRRTDSVSAVNYTVSIPMNLKR